MAGGKSTTFANDALTWSYSTAVAPTRPTAWNIALYTDATGLAAGSAGPSTEATTSNCPGYARQSMSVGSSAVTGKQTANTNDIQFTATGAWATVNYYAIIDQTGRVLDWAPLATSRTLQISGDKIDFAIGAIVVSES